MRRVFTARYALSPYIKQIRFVFKGLIVHAYWRLFEVRYVGCHLINFVLVIRLNHVRVPLVNTT
jgi:hypothetical protein